MSNLSDDPPFDLFSARKKLAGDEEILKELAEIFVDGCGGDVDLIRDAVRCQKSRELNLYAHRLKSSLSNFFAREASDAANELERIGRESDWESVDEALATLDKALARLLPALSGFYRS